MSVPPWAFHERPVVGDTLAFIRSRCTACQGVMMTGEKSVPRLLDEECIFCKIIAGEIPCSRVYEDEHILAFLDVNPIARGHTLVVPKEHFSTLLDVPVELGGALLFAMKRIGAALRKTTGASGFNCMQNNFSAAGQMVFHSHWHIIPRFENDGLPDWPGGRYKDSAEMQQLAKSIGTQTSED